MGHLEGWEDEYNTIVLILSMKPSPLQTPREERSDTATTRDRIVAAAETLFAARGVEDVSLVEIGKAAGQRNRSAVQYHFQDKAGLIHAILDKHTPGIERRRHARLDALGPGPDLRSAVEALVLPVAEKLEDTDGGVAFVRLSAELIGNARYPLLRLGGERRNPAADRLAALFDAVAAPVPELLWPTRWLLVVGLLFHGLADWSRIAEENDAARRRVFVSHLVDQIEAVLAAPPSPATRAALASAGGDTLAGPSRGSKLGAHSR
jgi:AcrR family transcriptional regulator